MARRVGAGVESFLVPAARELPSNRAYIRQLTLSNADPSLIRLATNENTDHPSERVRDVLAHAWDTANLYATTNELEARLAAFHLVDPSQVVVGAGATEVIEGTLRAFVRAGDEVVVTTPSWPVCRARLVALEASLVDIELVPGETSWSFDTDAILGAIGPRTKLIVVCTPNNPTGNAMALDDLRCIAAVGVPFLVDAAYSDFDAAVDLMPLVREFENVVLTRTFAKVYALAGLRCGYGIGDPTVLDYVDRFMFPGSVISSAAVAACLAALDDQEHHEAQVRRIVAERERITPALRELGLRVWDSRANFVSVDASGFDGGPEQLVAAVLEHGVVLRPLFQLVRISVGLPHENDAMLAAVEAALEDLNGS